MEDEISWLKKKCPYFKDAYINYLAAFRFRPAEQVTIIFVPSESDPEWGQIEIEVHGFWGETILYEVPLMAALSEAYFRTVDTAWNLEGQEGLDKHHVTFIKLTIDLFSVCRACLSERIGATP
jgi:nicotinate phosphoribosyltransferase